MLRLTNLVSMAQSLPLTSVIVVGYNSRKHLRRCFKSLLNQTYNLYEVIYVDNCSTDNSAEYVKKHFSNWVRVIKSLKNLGYTGGCNLGIRHSKGEIIILLNPDTEVRPKFIEKCVKYLLSSERIGILAPLIKNNDRWVAYSKINLYTGQSRNFSTEIDTITDSDYVSGCAMVIRRKLLAEIGLLDERYFSYYEDSDFCLRAHKHGWRVVVIPEKLVYHYSGGSYSRTSPNKYYLTVRNKILFIAKNASKLNLLIFITISEPLTLLGDILALFAPMRIRWGMYQLGLMSWLPDNAQPKLLFLKLIFKARFDALLNFAKFRSQTSQCLYQR